MIIVNIEKAKAIALKVCEQLTNEADKAAFAKTIGDAVTTNELALIIEQIKTELNK